LTTDKEEFGFIDGLFKIEANHFLHSVNWIQDAHWIPIQFNTLDYAIRLDYTPIAHNPRINSVYTYQSSFEDAVYLTGTSLNVFEIIKNHYILKFYTRTLDKDVFDETFTVDNILNIFRPIPVYTLVGAPVHIDEKIDQYYIIKDNKYINLNMVSNTDYTTRLDEFYIDGLIRYNSKAGYVSEIPVWTFVRNLTYIPLNSEVQDYNLEFDKSQPEANLRVHSVYPFETDPVNKIDSYLSNVLYSDKYIISLSEVKSSILTTDFDYLDEKYKQWSNYTADSESAPSFRLIIDSNIVYTHSVLLDSIHEYDEYTLDSYQKISSLIKHESLTSEFIMINLDISSDMIISTNSKIIGYTSELTLDSY
jgi:hypothetical protein